MKNLQTEVRNRRVRVSGDGLGIACGGFTLLEVIMGVALVTLLFGGIYGIANASMDLGRSVSENRMREMRASGLVNLLRGGLGSLPPGSLLELPGSEEGAGRRGEVRVVDAPGLWAWSGVTAAADAVALVTEEVAEGTDLVLAHLRVVEGGEVGGEGAEYEEFSRAKLVTVATFRWEYFDGESGEWVEEWADAEERPALLAISFSLPGDPGERRHVMEVARETAPDAGSGAEGREAPTGTNGDTNEERGEAK